MPSPLSRKPAVSAALTPARAEGTSPASAGLVFKPLALNPEKCAAKVLAGLALTADPYTHYEERVAQEVKALSVKLKEAVAVATTGAGPAATLQKQFRGCTVDVVMAASVFEHESIQYLVYEPDSKRPRRFVVSPAGKLIEDPEASEAVLARVRLKNGKATFSPVSYPRRIPVFSSPPFAPGREVDVPSRSGVRSGKLVSVGDGGRWTIELTTEGGKAVRKTFDPYEVVRFNAHHEFDLRGGTFSEVSLDVEKDPKLKKFVDEALQLVRPILEAADVGLAGTVAAQKKALAVLMKHVQSNLEYPSTPEFGGGTIGANDPRSIRFNQLMAKAQLEGAIPLGEMIPLGELLSIRAGLCRHRAIAMQACLQVAGIDSRLTSGGAFTAGGVYRGPHAWLEVTLADGTRYLSDPQWGDAFVPLRETYEKDVRRREEHQKTEHLDWNLVR